LKASSSSSSSSSSRTAARAAAAAVAAADAVECSPVIDPALIYLPDPGESHPHHHQQQQKQQKKQQHLSGGILRSSSSKTAAFRAKSLLKLAAVESSSLCRACCPDWLDMELVKCMKSERNVLAAAAVHAMQQ
jgi:hypothetical protein